MDELIEWAPESCTLPTVEQPLRLAEFDKLFAQHLQAVTRVDRATVELMLAEEARADAAELTVRESECCSFFRFEFLPAEGDVVRLRITVPPAQIDVLDALSTRALQVAGL